MSEYGHDACLAMQIRSLVLVLQLASVYDLHRYLQRYSHCHALVHGHPAASLEALEAYPVTNLGHRGAAGESRKDFLRHFYEVRCNIMQS